MATRAERAAEAAALKAAGVPWYEAARRMGVSRSYYFELLTDPDGAEARERKDFYRGECEQCGVSTHGSNGRGPNAPRYCAKCRPDAYRIWTREAILDAIGTFAERYGRPTATDFNPAHARRVGAIAGIEEFVIRPRRQRKEQDRHPGLLPRETYDRMRDRQHIIDRQRDVARWQ